MVEEIYGMILEEIYKECTAIIKLHKVGDKIPIQKGLDNDSISPNLFMAFL